MAQASNVRELGKILWEMLNLPVLGYTDMESLIKYIFELSREETIVLVLDEYQYLRESVKGMDIRSQSHVSSGPTLVDV